MCEETNFEEYNEDYSENYNEYEDYYESHENNEEWEDNENSDNFCDACEKGFATSALLKNHIKEHRVCGIDGCKFVAHSKILEKHIRMQHETGLYYRMSQSNTAEDIEKWIAERKKKYPTKENIEKRQKEQEEMIKRGERISEPKDRFGRKNKKDTIKKNPKNKNNRFKNKKNKLSHLRKTPPKLKKLIKKDVPSTSLLNDKSSWNGKLCPFQGTSEIYDSEEQVEEEKIDDSEWQVEEHKETPKILLNNALGALIGAYRSSDDSEDEIAVPDLKVLEIPKSEVPNNENMKDNEAPEEVKIIKDNPQCHLYIDNNKEETEQEKCAIKQNRKRKRKHSRNENISNKKIPKSNLSNQPTCTRKITLLEKLLAPEIRHERNVILQCVRYVVKNNFFEKENIDSDKETNNEIISDDSCEVAEASIQKSYSKNIFDMSEKPYKDSESEKCDNKNDFVIPPDNENKILEQNYAKICYSEEGDLNSKSVICTGESFVAHNETGTTDKIVENKALVNKCNIDKIIEESDNKNIVTNNDNITVVEVQTEFNDKKNSDTAEKLSNELETNKYDNKNGLMNTSGNENKDLNLESFVSKDESFIANNHC